MKADIKADLDAAILRFMYSSDRADKRIGRYTTNGKFVDLKAADIERAPEWITGAPLSKRRRRSVFVNLG